MSSRIPSHRVRELATRQHIGPLGIRGTFASPDNPLLPLNTPGIIDRNSRFEASQNSTSVSLLQDLLDELFRKDQKPYVLPTPRKKQLKLSEGDYQKAAKDVGCDEAMIVAIASIESKSSPYLANGRPKILFERHWFRRITKKVYDESNPGISAAYNRKANGYLGGAQEYLRLEEAMGLDVNAALKSASWGQFQIMGFNHKAAGFTKVTEFVTAMYGPPINHLNALVSFLQSKKADKFIKTGTTPNFKKFATTYNGTDAIKNNYHVKLKKAYKKAALIVSTRDRVQKDPMTLSISAKVGKGGANHSNDVALVQFMLNLWLPTGSEIKVDGDAGSRTIKAIKKFQRDSLKMGKPDGRVDPGKTTFTKLQMLAVIMSGNISAILWKLFRKEFPELFSN